MEGTIDLNGECVALSELAEAWKFYKEVKDKSEEISKENVEFLKSDVLARHFERAGIKVCEDEKKDPDPQGL
jgi:hypothetical protein